MGIPDHAWSKEEIARGSNETLGSDEVDCPSCGRPFAEESGVLVSTGGEPWFVAYVPDLRIDPEGVDHVHVRCWVTDPGIDDFLKLVQVEDRKWRMSRATWLDRIWTLETRLRDLDELPDPD